MSIASPEWRKGFVRRTLERLRSGLAPVLVVGLALGLSGGGCDVLTPSESAFSFSGTWTADGTIQFRKKNTSRFETLTARLVLTISQHSHITKNGVPLSGTWSITFADPAMNRSGTLSARANRGQQCSQGATTTVCSSSDPYVDAIENIVLTSTSACSTLYAPQHVIVENDAFWIVGLGNGENGQVTDATCGDPWNYDKLQTGQFKLTRK